MRIVLPLQFSFKFVAALVRLIQRADGITRGFVELLPVGLPGREPSSRESFRISIHGYEKTINRVTAEN
jgi:hypothetical protein